MKKFLVCSLVSVLLCAACVGAPQTISRDALSYNSNNSEIVYVTNDTFDSDEPVTYGWYTSLSLAIDCGDGKVWATVKNSFTLFKSTVYVKVELYNSDVYYESYKDMHWEASRTDTDLDMGETLTVEVSTYGRQKYWQARLYYKIDNKEWKETCTGTILVDGDGNYIS